MNLLSAIFAPNIYSVNVYLFKCHLRIKSALFFKDLKFKSALL